MEKPGNASDRNISMFETIQEGFGKMANAGPLFGSAPYPVEPTRFEHDPPRDDEQERGLGPEDGTGQIAGGPAGNTITMNVTGTAAAAAPAALYDLWWMYSLFGEPAPGPQYAVGAVDIQTEDGLWTPALVALYVGFAPLFIVNTNLTGFNNPAAVSGFSIRVKSSDPFGNTAGNLQPQSAYQNASDFRNDRGQQPNAQPLNGWTWIRMVAPIQAVPTTGTVTHFFGPRQDPMALVPRVAPQIVRSVNR